MSDTDDEKVRQLQDDIVQFALTAFVLGLWATLTKALMQTPEYREAIRAEQREAFLSYWCSCCTHEVCDSCSPVPTGYCFGEDHTSEAWLNREGSEDQ